MNEFYVEQLVRREAATKATLIKNVCLGVTIAMIIGTFFIPILLFVAIILLVVDYFMLKFDRIEYEYLYLNGGFDIDKIIAMTKRKQVYSFHVNDVIIAAPVNSPEVRPYQNMKPIDFSTGIVSETVYKVILNKDGQNVAILIEPNVKILNGMKMMAPRKIFI